MNAAHLTPSDPTASHPSCATPKFAFGRLVITAQARAVLAPHDVRLALARHVCGDWGECSGADKQANEQALVAGERLLSVYRGAGGTRFWIITDAPRTSTTVLLPEDN